MKKEIVRWSKIVFNNFIAIPRIAKEELDPYEFKLYAHYIDESRWNSSLASGVRETAKSIGIGKNTVGPARKSLQDKGYLTITEGVNPDDPDMIVLDSDIWRRNSEKYDTPEKHQERALEALELGDLTEDTLDKLEAILRKAGRVPDQGHQRPESGTDSYIKSSNVPKGTLRPAKARTQPPVITGRSGSEDDPPDPNVEGYTAAELWVYHNQKKKKPLSDSMRGRMNNPPSHLNDKGIVVADETVNKLFDTDKAYPIWCVEWVLPALKNTIGANQKHYKPSPSSLIDFMRNLDKFYEWKAKQPEARFKPLRKIISSV